MEAAGEDISEIDARPGLAPDHALYFNCFWILSPRRPPTMGSTPCRIQFSELERVYGRYAADVTDFDTFREAIDILDSEYCHYMTPKEDREKAKRQMEVTNTENADLKIWT